MPSLPRLTLYSRAACHLCEEMKAVLERVRTRRPFALAVLDIDSDPELRARFDQEVPVLFVEGRKAFKYRVTEGELEARLLRPAP